MTNDDLVTPPLWVSIWINKMNLEPFRPLLLQSGADLFYGVHCLSNKLLRLSRHTQFIQLFCVRGRLSRSASCLLLHLFFDPWLHIILRGNIAALEIALTRS